MVERLFRKGLVLGIILLFIGIGITPLTQRTVAEESKELEDISPSSHVSFIKPHAQGIYYKDRLIVSSFPFCLIIGTITVILDIDGGYDKIVLSVDGKSITFYGPPYEYVWVGEEFFFNYIQVTGYWENHQEIYGFPLIKIF
jgi:hypothetical protein